MEIRWPSPRAGGGQRVGEGCWSKVGMTGDSINPSLISISSPQASPKLSTQQEAERQALQSLRQGGALTGKFMSTSSIPGCLLGVALEGDTSPHGHASLLQHVLLLEQARQQTALIAGEWAGSCPRRGCQPPPHPILRAQGRTNCQGEVARDPHQPCHSSPPRHH